MYNCGASDISVKICLNSDVKTDVFCVCRKLLALQPEMRVFGIYSGVECHATRVNSCEDSPNKLFCARITRDLQSNIQFYLVPWLTWLPMFIFCMYRTSHHCACSFLPDPHENFRSHTSAHSPILCVRLCDDLTTNAH